MQTTATTTPTAAATAAPLMLEWAGGWMDFCLDGGVPLPRLECCVSLLLCLCEVCGNLITRSNNTELRRQFFFKFNHTQ